MKEKGTAAPWDRCIVTAHGKTSQACAYSKKHLVRTKDRERLTQLLCLQIFTSISGNLLCNMLASFMLSQCPWPIMNAERLRCFCHFKISVQTPGSANIREVIV